MLKHTVFLQSQHFLNESNFSGSFSFSLTITRQNENILKTKIRHISHVWIVKMYNRWSLYYATCTVRTLFVAPLYIDMIFNGRYVCMEIALRFVWMYYDVTLDCTSLCSLSDEHLYHVYSSIELGAPGAKVKSTRQKLSTHGRPLHSINKTKTVRVNIIGQ